MSEPYAIPPWARIARQIGPVGYAMFRPGRRYEVIRAYTDYDYRVHPQGERFTFLAHNFLPYDGGHSFFVSFDDESESQIRMQENEQAAVLDDLRSHFRAL